MNVRGQHTTMRAHQKLRNDRMDMRSAPSASRSSSPSGSGASRLDRRTNTAIVATTIDWLDTKRPVFRQLGAGIIVGGRAVSPVAGYDGFGRQEGWVEAHGERFDLDTDTHLGTRDHHWGTRDGVGGPGRYMGMQHPHSGEWVEFEDFGIWGDHVLYNLGDPRETQCNARPSASTGCASSPTPTCCTAARSTCVFADGSVKTMTFERLGNQIAFLRCGMYGGPNGGTPDGDLWHGMAVAAGRRGRRARRDLRRQRPRASAAAWPGRTSTTAASPATAR